MAEDGARRALDALLAGQEPAVADFDQLRDVVIRYLRGAWPGLDVHAAGDSADEALTRVLMRTSHDGPPQGQPLPYLLRTARNLQIDSHRRRRESAGLPEALSERASEVDDRSILAMLDAQASLSEVRGALALARQEHDYIVGQVVQAWLDLAQATEQAPSTRDVGDAAGVAHTTVGAALKRFGGYLIAAREA